ncbi:MAG: enoyl-CoA hydratase/isomerase family protein [Ktedonobacterales bacterium]|nr:enoyl-CoA hydratase/isomerase family protein [Ktedonobacterales bacterium]
MENSEIAGGPWERDEYAHVRVARHGIAAIVTLARPEVHNAFNERLIAELRTVFDRVGADDSVRAVVLRGEGKNFCAGADLNWMRASLDRTHDENIADALRMADMFQAIDTCRHPVIGRIHGYALGGGSGLTAVCDLAIAAGDAHFGFTEARLGIAPAVISPFVLRKIGESHARALFLTAERFDAARALAIGLIHHVVPAAELDAAVAAALHEIARNGPAGVRAAKVMARTVPQLEGSEARETTAATIASLRVSQEGQAGIHAFLEKRPAPWVTDDA